MKSKFSNSVISREYNIEISELVLIEKFKYC